MNYALVIVFLLLTSAAAAQQQSPVEQRLGAIVGSVMVENVRLVIELEAARQALAKLQAERKCNE